MYKFANHISSSNLILVRKKLGDGSCAALVVMRAPRRNYAYDESCRATPTPKKSTKLFWGTLGAAVLSGSAIVYAKHSPKTREWLASNVPWADRVVALAYQEDTTYYKFATENLQKAVTKVSQFLFGIEDVTPELYPSRADQDIDKDAEKAFAPRTYPLPPKKLEPLYIEEPEPVVPEVEEQAILIQTEVCEQGKPEPIKITKTMVELEEDMHDFTRKAIDTYKQALKANISYNRAVTKIVESNVEDLDGSMFTTVQGALQERNTAMAKAHEYGAKARCAIDSLDRLIKGGVQAPPDTIASTYRFIKTFKADLDEAETSCKLEYEKSNLYDKYKNKVMEARKFYQRELQTVFPGLDINARKLDVRGDPDLLLLYTMKQVLYLQKELAEIQTIRELKLSRALECNDEKLLVEAKADDMVKQERIARELEFQKQVLEVQAEADRKLKEQLRKLIEAQLQAQDDAVKRKEAELMKNMKRTASEQIEQERIKFKKELAEMAGKLRAIEQTLKKRAKAEDEARRSQALWTAAEALLAATKKSGGERIKVEKEIAAVEKAGKGDKLVTSVMKGVSPEAKEEGILTDLELKERFNAMEKRARRVALVGREGAALPIYLLSWLQDKLMFDKLAEIPEDELNNLPTDFSELDTFDIMYRARYYMDRGDVYTALKYINLLQGAPRAASMSWVNETKRHLEVKQAAEAVMTHASASAMLHQ